MKLLIANACIAPLNGLTTVLMLAGGALILNGCGKEESASQPQTTPGSADSPPPGHKHGPGESMALHTDWTKLKFSAEPAPLAAGKTAHWTLNISDLKTGKSVAGFVKMHDKLLHLIVTSKDLSFYTHIHPRYEGNGKFSIDYALPRAGKYRLYADYVTAAMQHEVAHQDFQVAGSSPLPDKPKLKADKIQGAWMVGKFGSHEEGKSPSPGATVYEVAMMPMPMIIHAGEEAMLHFQIRDAKGQPIRDLMPYMGAMGHAVILSSDGEIYLHTHPMEGDMAEMMAGSDGHAHGGHGGGEKEMLQSMMKSLPAETREGPNVMFHTMFPKPGIYRVWGQFMHRNKVITAAFNVPVLPAVKK